MEMRVRSFENNTLSGYLTYGPDDVVARGYYAASHGYCLDFWRKDVTYIEDTTYVIGWLPSSPCEIKRWDSSPCFVNDGGPGHWGLFHAHGWPIGDTDPFIGSPYPPYGSAGRVVLSNQFAIQLLEETNPGRPEYSISQQAFDAADFAAMFKLVGSTLASFVGNSYLNYRFGWETFLSDMKTLQNVVKLLDSRIRELSSLTKLGGLRRGKELATLSSSSSSGVVYFSTTWAVYIEGIYHYNSSIKVRGTVHWTCTQDFEDDLSHIGGAILALKEFFDLEDPDLETAWQMLPFSWLADYFITIGSYLTGTADSFKFIPNDICIIYEGFATATGDPLPHPEYTTTGGTWKGHVYSRDIVQGVEFPSFRVDFLSETQLATCLALLSKFHI